MSHRQRVGRSQDQYRVAAIAGTCLLGRPRPSGHGNAPLPSIAGWRLAYMAGEGDAERAR